jgi:hypothetical protein
VQHLSASERCWPLSQADQRNWRARVGDSSTVHCDYRSSLEALQQDLARAGAELKEVEGRLHEMEAKNDQVAKLVRHHVLWTISQVAATAATTTVPGLQRADTKVSVKFTV